MIISLEKERLDFLGDKELVYIYDFLHHLILPHESEGGALALTFQFYCLFFFICLHNKIHWAYQVQTSKQNMIHYVAKC